MARSLRPPWPALARPGLLASPALAHPLTLPALADSLRPPWFAMARSLRPPWLARFACLPPSARSARAARPLLASCGHPVMQGRLNEGRLPRTENAACVPLQGVEASPIDLGSMEYDLVLVVWLRA